MLTPFDKLPPESRIWIYQCSRLLTEEESEDMRAMTAMFLENWTAHGASLRAGFEIPYNHFLCIALDQGESVASGCSIDSQVRFIQSLQEKFKMDMLDKMNVVYRQLSDLKYVSLIYFKKKAKLGEVTENTIVFNNLVVNIEEYRTHWEVPAGESWHARFF